MPLYKMDMKPEILRSGSPPLRILLLMSIWKLTNKVLCKPIQFTQQKYKHLQIVLLINNLLNHILTVDYWTREILATEMLPFSVSAPWRRYSHISLSAMTHFLHLHLLFLQLCHCWDLLISFGPVSFCSFWKGLLGLVPTSVIIFIALGFLSNNLYSSDGNVRVIIVNNYCSI